MCAVTFGAAALVCRAPTEQHRAGYLESKDDGPHQPEGQAVVPVHNVMRAHIFQVHFLLLQELQRLVHVLQAVDPHAALCGLWLSRDRGHKAMGPWASSSFPPSFPGALLPTPSP